MMTTPARNLRKQPNLPPIQAEAVGQLAMWPNSFDANLAYRLAMQAVGSEWLFDSDT